VDTLAAYGPAQAVDADLAKRLMQIAPEDTPAALARFESRETSLPAADSAARLARNGPKEIGPREAAARLVAPVALLQSEVLGRC